MNMRRLPVDIEFLLESVLSESPDKVTFMRDDKLRMKNFGIKPPTVNSFHWKENDALAFFIHVKPNVVVLSTDTHGDMETMLKAAADKAMIYPYSFKKYFTVSVNANGLAELGTVPKFDEVPQKLSFYNLDISKGAEEAVKTYLRNNRVYFKNLNIRGEKNFANVPSGRLWRKRNVVSFWNKRATILPFFDLIFKLFDALGMNKTSAIYEFLDTRGFFAYPELTGADTKEKLSSKEMEDLLKAQHLDPKAKEKLTGDEYKDLHLKKAAKGFDYAAKAGAAVPALEGHIKLKDLVAESPDSVYMNGAKITNWIDNDAIAFAIFPTFSVINRGGTHYDIIDILEIIYNDYAFYEDHTDSAMKKLKRSGLEVSNINGVLESLSPTGLLGKFYAAGGRGASAKYRDLENSITGRLWPMKKIVSFWNEKSKVVKHWKDFVDFFKYFAPIENFGEFELYKIDWIERSNSDKTPLGTASDVTSGSSDDKQMNFFDLLEKPKTQLSNDEIKKIQNQLHVMSADKKKKIMLDMGYRNTKVADIADKLNMTVAEFNSIMNVNEGTSE